MEIIPTIVKPAMTIPAMEVRPANKPLPQRIRVGVHMAGRCKSSCAEEVDLAFVISHHTASMPHTKIIKMNGISNKVVYAMLTPLG
jgi:hypothetical protein